MLTLHQLSYAHSNRDLLFSNVNLSVNRHEKAALIGINGIGKSTLLKIISGELPYSDGQLKVEVEPYYVPQIFGQYNHLNVAQALRIDEKLMALKKILNGNSEIEYFNALNEDWTIEERARDALKFWNLDWLDYTQKLSTLSGGQKTRVFLAGIAIHKPQLILMDEPSNHLDLSGRTLLYDFISHTKSSVVVVSHDRKLLNLLDATYEFNKNGLKAYGGNYDFYIEQKQIEKNALYADVNSKEKALKKAREKERKTDERQQKLDARGKKKQTKAGMGKAMMNKMKNDAENSTSRLKNIHAEKKEGLHQDLAESRSALPDIDKMKLGFKSSTLHTGKILFDFDEVNFGYKKGEMLWKSDLNFKIVSGERIAFKGKNGSGKTSLINLILGGQEPQKGILQRAEVNSVYIDQDYSLINNKLTVYEQAESFNSSPLEEYEVKIRLNRFLFDKEDWDKVCGALSGGERMRLILCCLTIGSKIPDLIVLDEPTNNLDLQNIEILTTAINEYQGTLVVVSHDETFLKEIRIERTINLDHF